MNAVFPVLTLVLLTGCSKRTEVKTTEGAGPINTSLRTNRLSTAQFFQQIYVPAYEQHGRKDPKWDEPVKAFFSKLAASAESPTNDPAMDKEVEDLIEAMQAAGCEDALARYMILRRTKDPHFAGESGTNEWVQVALDLAGTGYHQYWKFFSYMRAAQALKSTSPKTNSPAVVKFRDDASSRLVELVKDYSLPTTVMFDAVHRWINVELWGAPNLRKWTYDQVEQPMMEGWGDTAEAQLVRGAYHVRYAWDARGGGWASEVSEEGWKRMSERLQIARDCLEQSWRVKPLEETAVRMLWVEVGDSRGREAMELWFKRALEVNPGSYDACDNKLTWLSPKWHGSATEMITFGHQCLTNRRGEIPLILYHSHQQLATYQQQAGRGLEKDYWKQPGVWPDVKISFETFFEVNPDALGWRHNYALAAYKAKAWDDLRKQIKLLGPINYPYFGGKEAFEKMVREAEENGKI